MKYNVVIKEVAPENLASIRATCSIAELPEVMGRQFGRIIAALSAEGIQPSAGALAIYHGWTQDTVDVEIAFVIQEIFHPRIGQSGVAPSKIPGGRVAFTTHVGPYEEIQNGYGAIRAYAQENSLKLADMMWECYLTDPAVEPDLRKHITELYWPLA